MIFFFKQKTAYEIYQCDWSSDVCSSDLNLALLDLFFSDNQMLAWQAQLAEGPVTSWTKVVSLRYHTFDRDGQAKKDRKLVTKIGRASCRERV